MRKIVDVHPVDRRPSCGRSWRDRQLSVSPISHPLPLGAFAFFGDAFAHAFVHLAGHGRDLSNANILVLGLTYRPGVEELRYAPALNVIERLRNEGAAVFAHDPLLDDETVSEIGARPTDLTDIQDLDGVILATGHDRYRDLDLGALRDAMRTPVFVDGRAFFDPEEMGPFTYAQIANGETET